MNTHGLEPGRFALLHVGMRDAGRRWAPELFARAGDAIAARGLKVAVTGALGDAEQGAAVAAAMQEPCLDLTGKTSIGPWANCSAAPAPHQQRHGYLPPGRGPADSQRGGQLHRPVPAERGDREVITEAERLLACTRPRVTIHAA